MFRALTNRERQILNLIADGLTNKEIARHLSISEATVENHIHHIYVKLRISNRAQAVGYAFRLKMRVLQNDLLKNGGNPS